jgi:hypothetical protein
MTKLHLVKPPASEAHIVGYEPTWEPNSITKENRASELQRGLTWHNDMADKDDPYQYIEEWLQDDKKRLAEWKKVPEKVMQGKKTLAALARMGLQGFPLNDKEKNQIDVFITGAILNNDKTDEDAPPRLSVQDHMRAQILPILSDFDVLQDSIFDTKKPLDNPIMASYNIALKTQHFAIIEKYITPKVAEWKEAVDAMNKKYKDDTSIQLAEAYEYAGKKKLNLAIERFEQILVNVGKQANTVKVQAVRKKKPADKAKLVKRLKFLGKDEKLGLESIVPSEVLGASSVWVYDTVKRKLGHYVGESSGSLYVKGTTLLGFDEKKSVQKTMRKPETQLKEFMKLRKLNTQNEWFDEVKAVGSVLTGRTNTNLLILRAE